MRVGRGTPRASLATTHDLLAQSQKLEETAQAFRVGEEFDLLTQGWVEMLPLMEVAPPPAERFLSEAGRVAYRCKVRERPSLESAVVAELHPHSLVRALGYRDMSDGSRRALVALHKAGAPLGWVTSSTSDSEPMLYVFARPIYEVNRPVVVHKAYSPLSQLVGHLKAGARLHVLETRRDSAGCQRVKVRLLGDRLVLGWCVLASTHGRRTMGTVDTEAEAPGQLERQVEQIRTPRTPRPLSPRSRSPRSRASRAGASGPTRAASFRGGATHPLGAHASKAGRATAYAGAAAHGRSRPSSVVPPAMRRASSYSGGGRHAASAAPSSGSVADRLPVRRWREAFIQVKRTVVSFADLKAVNA
jgi:hypothetical protein